MFLEGMDLLSLRKPVFDLQPQYNTRTNNILCLKENVILVPTDCTQKVHQRACLANCTEQLDPDFSLGESNSRQIYSPNWRQ